jgi:hypothetical protein
MSNARPKRLNEIDKPVIDFTIADAQHQLIIPQNTTTNLADIPNKTASIAFDTTLDKVVFNDGTGFAPISSGGGGGAALDLSNLTAPTAVNQSLLPGTTMTSTLGDSTAVWADVSTAELDMYNPADNHFAGSVTVTRTGTNSSLTLTSQDNLTFSTNHSGSMTIDSSWTSVLLTPNINGSGSWLAAPIDTSHGGTGATSAAAGFAAIAPLATAGDIIYENATPAPAALPIGAAGQVLTVTSGLPAWGPGVHSFTSTAGTGGSGSQAMTVTGLLATDNVIAVSQKTGGTNGNPLLGWTTVANNSLTVNWVTDPGPGSVIVVTVLR